MTERMMTNYYAKRADEYERIYLKPERQDDLKLLQTKLSECFIDLDLLEIACGTGYWTQFACRSAKSITATDYNEEVLKIAREKHYGTCPVTFLKADAYKLNEVDGPFSAALVAFWWSHVPKSKLDDFYRILHSKLYKGAYVIMLDNRYVEGSSTPINRIDEEGNTYQMRKLSDGSVHEVVKNFPERSDFLDQMKPFTDNFKLLELDYFWLAEYILK